MNPSIECIRCHAQMEDGFLVDVTDSGPRQQSWFPGKPEPSFWTGLKGLKKDERIPVTTRRCPKCGYLESYAVKQTSPDT